MYECYVKTAINKEMGAILVDRSIPQGNEFNFHLFRQIHCDCLLVSKKYLFKFHR